MVSGQWSELHTFKLLGNEERDVGIRNEPFPVRCHFRAPYNAILRLDRGISFKEWDLTG